jgi:DUF971 family protein
MGSTWVQLCWADGFEQRVPTSILRGYCPCATCQGHGGSLVFIPGHDSDLLEITPVGNYGLRLVWGDRHETGIYTFTYLRQLSDLYARHGDELPARQPELSQS